MTTPTVTVAIDTTEMQAMLSSALARMEQIAAQVALSQAANPSGAVLATTAMAAAASSRELSRRSFLGLGWRRCE